MAYLRIPADFRPELIIFDKDGTLIDFDFMWGGWIVALARRLEAAACLPVAAHLYQAVGYDSAAGRVAPGGPLAVATMAELREMAAETLRALGLPREQAQRATEQAWYSPDPVALARPLADLPRLLGALRARGLRIAIATTDDRAPTEATVAALGIAPLVDALACGDDGHPIKPAPDAVLLLCGKLGVDPARAMVVGDTLADLRMGRAAGASLVVGVLSGAGTDALLSPEADALLTSVADLPTFLFEGSKV